MQTAIASLIVFGIIIFVHEFGHFIIARLVGIRVEEFALGMGPKILSTKKGDTVYSLRVFPLGGFCKMAGENGNQGYDTVEVYDPGRFDQKSVKARMGVVVAGPLMNFFLAAVLLSLIFIFLGVPKDYTTKIGDIAAGGPAESAGIMAGDKVLQVNDTEINLWSEMVAIINGNPGVPLKMQIERSGSLQNIVVTPKLDPDRKVGLIGITPVDLIWQRIGFFAGLKAGLLQTWDMTVLIVTGLVDLVRGKVGVEGIAGPVGIVKIIGESTRFGLVNVVNLTALISINLGLINLLPIPALDGSRLLFMLYEAIRGKPVNPKKEGYIHLVGFALLMGFMVMVTFQDILKIFM